MRLLYSGIIRQAFLAAAAPAAATLLTATYPVAAPAAATFLVAAPATLVAAAQPVAAQSPRPLSIQTALQLARENNHQIRQADVGVEKANLAVREVRSTRLPSVSIDGQYGNYLELPVLFLPPGGPFGDGALRMGSQHNFNSSLQASMPLYNVQLNRTVDLTQAADQLEEAMRDATVREVEIEVQRAFVNGLVTGAALEVLEQSRRTLEENLRLITALHQQGLAPEYDLIRTEVLVTNMEPELSRARNNHEGALNYIKLLTGISIQQQIQLDGSLEEMHASVRSLDFEPDFGRNHQLIQVEGRHELAERQLAVQRAAYLPSIAAVGNYTYQAQGDDLAVQDYNWVNSATVGLRVSIPLFSGGRSERTAQAELDRQQAEMQRAFLLESLRSRFETTASRLRALEQTIQAQERNVAQAERGYEIARVSYEEGVYSLLEVNDAEAALREARLNYQAALSEYINGVLDMEDLVGGGVTASAGNDGNGL